MPVQAGPRGLPTRLCLLGGELGINWYSPFLLHLQPQLMHSGTFGARVLPGDVNPDDGIICLSSLEERLIHAKKKYNFNIVNYSSGLSCRQACSLWLRLMSWRRSMIF